MDNITDGAVVDLVPEPTLDQEAIRDAVEAGKSLRVVAHAGTGKTTTLLWSLARRPTERVLLLEYNRDLRLDAKRLAREAGLAHVTVHNYDSFLLEYYDRTAPSRDFQMALQRVLRENIEPLNPFDFTVIIVDEAQDMTEPYAQLLQKILTDNGGDGDSSSIRIGDDGDESEVQLILAGDPKQTIYAFRGAKSEYLVAKNRWDWGSKIPLNVCELTLAETFRFGDGLCGFVNGLCSSTFKPVEWGADIVSAFPGGSVEAWTMDVGSRTAEPPTALLETYRAAAAAGSVCILAQSLREENTLLTCFLEQASRCGLAPTEDENINGQHQQPFLPVLRTVHTSKGRQYRTVFFFLSQADSWLTETGRLKKERNTLLYVGCTRAREHLHLVQGSDERVLDRIRSKCSRRDAQPLLERMATTGSLIMQRTTPPPPDTRFVPAFVYSTVSALEKRTSIEDKERLLALLSFGTVRQGPKLDEPTFFEELAVRNRAEWHTIRGGTGALAPLLRWATTSRHNDVDSRIAYAKLARRSLCHLFLESFDEQLKAINPATTSWEDWVKITSFHPDRRYGHSGGAGGKKLVPRSELCAALYGAFVARCGDLDLIDAARLCGSDLTSACSHDHLFYIDKARQMVVCPIFCATEAIRPADIFAVTLAAGRLGLNLGCIAYLQRGVDMVVRIAPSAAALVEELVARNDRWRG